MTAEEISQLRSVFTGLYSLDPSESSPEALAALQAKVFASPQNYVLKPQREGGGNNIYGADIPPSWTRFSPQERKAHILMDRIVPPTQRCVLVRENAVYSDYACICELGVFGIYLAALTRLYSSAGANPSPASASALAASPVKPTVNTCGGYLLRVKPHNVDEGGVAAGFGVLGVMKLVA